MLDMIVLVTGVPALLFVMLIAMGRYESTVAPDLEPAEPARVQTLESRASGRVGRRDSDAVPAVVVGDAEQPRAA